jgi:hypothetical protein
MLDFIRIFVQMWSPLKQILQLASAAGVLHNLVTGVKIKLCDPVRCGDSWRVVSSYDEL